MMDQNQPPENPSYADRPAAASEPQLNSRPPTQQTQVPFQKKGWSPLAVVLALSAGFFAVFLVVSGIFFVMKGSSSKHAASAPGIFGNGAVGVLELSGVITESKKFIKKLKKFEEDDEIKAIVIRLDSPGGAVAPSQEIYQAVEKSKKPIFSSMGSVAASGAYYVASGTQKIYANPGTITGSIGVIMEFANLSKLYEWAKIERYSIKTGKFKDAGAEYREMTAEEKGLLQGMVDDVLVQFKEAVSKGRKMTMAEVTAIADGRIFSGNQAKKLKLVDETGTLDDAIHDAAKVAGIKGEPEVVYPEKVKRGVLDLIMDNTQGGDSDESSESRSAVRNFASPLDAVAGVIGRVVRAVGGESEGLQGNLPTTSPGIYWLWTGH